MSLDVWQALVHPESQYYPYVASPVEHPAPGLLSSLGRWIMAAPTRPITRESVEQDLVMVLSRLRRARQLEDEWTVELYEQEIDRLIARWVRITHPEPKPSHL